MAKKIEKRMGIETIVVVLGHIQREGPSTAFDRILATRFSVTTIDMMHEGKFGYMVALQGSNIVQVPLKDILHRRKTVDLGLYDVANVFSRKTHWRQFNHVSDTAKL